MYSQFQRENGQGLVEYALLLVFVAILSVAILSVLGTQVGTAFTNVGEVIDGGSITNLSTERRGKAGQKVRIYIETSSRVKVTIQLDDGRTKTKNCNMSCKATFNNVGNGNGTITVTSNDDTAVVPYAKAP